MIMQTLTGGNQMNLPTTFFLAAMAPMITNATPSAALVSEIERTYNSKIESQVIDSERSLFGCLIEKYQIIGHDPVTQKKRDVSVSMYRAGRVREKQNVVIILPPTGGVNILDRAYANELCSSGISVALISGWEHQNESSLDFSMHTNGALRALAAARHVIEFLQTEYPTSIGILGTSIGAIAGTLVMGFDTRVSSGVFIVGSARFADVIAESDETGASSLRLKRMKALGLNTVEEYRQAVRKAVVIEPSSFIGYTGKKRALVLSADADTTVASQYQFELADLLQAETHIRLRGNHLQGIKDSFWLHRKDILNFFLKAQGTSL
jgi:hypothetical protein